MRIVGVGFAMRREQGIACEQRWHLMEYSFDGVVINNLINQLLYQLLLRRVLDKHQRRICMYNISPTASETSQPPTGIKSHSHHNPRSIQTQSQQQSNTSVLYNHSTPGYSYPSVPMLAQPHSKAEQR